MCRRTARSRCRASGAADRGGERHQARADGQLGAFRGGHVDVEPHPVTDRRESDHTTALREPIDFAHAEDVRRSQLFDDVIDALLLRIRDEDNVTPSAESCAA